MTDINIQIQEIIDGNDVVLFMKGSADFPQCGFSASVAHILNTLDVEFKGVDILQDADLRQGIKDFSDWPTIPQLYIKGQFIGGSDIVREMYDSGELKELLAENNLID